MYKLNYKKMPNIYLHPHESIYFLCIIYFLSSIYLHHNTSAVYKSNNIRAMIKKFGKLQDQYLKSRNYIFKNLAIQKQVSGIKLLKLFLTY